MRISTKTSGVSLHFEKHKANDSGVNRLQAHNERKPGAKHSNKNIKDERTADNVILKKSDGSYKKQVESIIAENRKGGLKGVRKDAVRMVEATVQLSGQVLDRPESEQEQVLIQSYEWIKQQFGEDNIVSAVIHKDETNMHLHVDFVPIKDGKLNAKQIINQTNLKRYQADFLKTLQENNKSMNFVRGSSELNGLPQDVFQAVQDTLNEERQEMLKDISEQQQKLDQREKALDTLRSSLEAHRDDFNAKVEEQTLKSKKWLKTQIRALEKRENAVEERENAVEEREKNVEKSEIKLLALIEKFEEEKEKKDMRIDTDIKVKSEDGHEAEVSCSSAKELQHIMELENIEKCNVTTNWMGQEVTNKPMTKAEVKEWAEMNAQDLDKELEQLKQIFETPTL